jgi:hypothetical protein
MITLPRGPREPIKFRNWMPKTASFRSDVRFDAQFTGLLPFSGTPQGPNLTSLYFRIGAFIDFIRLEVVEGEVGYVGDVDRNHVPLRKPLQRRRVNDYAMA